MKTVKHHSHRQEFNVVVHALNGLMLLSRQIRAIRDQFLQ